MLKIFYEAGILTELFPVLIFIGIGAMTDFRPLFSTPKMAFFGAAAQFGIFATIIAVLGLTALIPGLWDNIVSLGQQQEMFKDANPLHIIFKAAAAIGIIGAADGPPPSSWQANSRRSSWAHIGGGLLLYGAGADHPAAHHPCADD